MKDFQDFKNKQIVDLLVQKRFRIVRHLVFLLVFLILIYNENFITEFSLPIGYYVVLTIYITFIVMFYINMYVLVPLFFFKTKYILYILSLIVLVFIGIEFLGFMHKNFFDIYRVQDISEKYGRNHYRIILICASVISISTTIKLLQRWIIDSERITELKNLTYNMELNDLKNQISPHFLFNMLNNVKALTRTNPEMASTVIMKLSEFLRYQLYESNQEKTLLSSEIDFLSNFLNLERIRKDNLHIDFENNLDKQNKNSLLIPSGLFTVFVENAIKHSVDTTGNPEYIKINISIENKKLQFICINSKSQNYINNDTKNSGLGLVNIKRRLELLYNDKYELHINSTDKEYKVNLIIPI